MQRVRSLSVWLTVLLAIALAVPALAVPAQVAAQSGTLTVALTSDVATLDPSLNNARQNRNVYANIFDPLIGRAGASLEMVPGLAESWSPVDDLTWEIKLRRGVKFHNGDDFTARDVEYWLKRVADESFKSLFRSPFSVVTGSQVVDDYTLRLTTKDPYPILPNRLVELYAIPSEYVKRVGDEAFARAPVGTGPFKFVEWKKDDRITLQANPDYWGVKPQFNTVVFRAIPEASTRVAELVSGGVDVALGIPTESVEPIQNGARTTIATTPSGRVVFFGLDTKQAPLNDVRVRQALNYAVDKQTIVNALLGGRGYPVGVLLSSYDFGYDSSIEPYPYDPGKAKALLAEAGYAGGIKLTMHTPKGLYLQDAEIAQAVAQLLGDVGVDITLDPLDSTAYLQRMNSTNLSPMFFGAFGSGAVMDAYQLLQYDRTGHPLSYYANPEYDALLDQAARTIDNNARAELYRKLQRIQHDDAVKLFMFQYVDIYGIGRSIDWQPRADELLLMNSVGRR